MVPLPILWGWVLMATTRTDASASLVEQWPRWVLVPRGQAKTLHCILRDSQYPWMSWYQQDLRGQLELLATLRSSGDKEVVPRPGADYQLMRVNSTELRLHVANVTQGRTLYCTCSKDTARHPPWINE
uniref:Immunoglobulin V-set domain-containing protein n=1 Tax=Suricata suricatta TaxID=37032 RepID=A0A673T1R5_SURSU